MAECSCQIVRCCLKSALDAPGRIPNIRPAAKQLFRAKSYCSTPTLYDSRELTCRWHQCTSILTRLKPANSIPTIMQSIILVAPFAMDRHKYSGCRKTPQKTDATEQRGVCAGGKKPTARSIKQDFETFLKVSKSAQRGEKTFSTRCMQPLFCVHSIPHCVISGD